MQIESTTNPNVLKFVGKERYFPETTEYTQISQCSNAPLAAMLLQFPFVKSVLTSGNFIAVEKSDEVDWEIVQEGLNELIEEEMSRLKHQSEKPIAVEVYIEATPNPNVIKLVSNRLLYEGIAEASHKEATEHFPLAQKLMEFPYVKEVFLTQNYVSLTKTEKADWQDHSLEIRDVFAQMIRKGETLVEETYIPHHKKTSPKENKKFSDLEKEIQSILEEYIQPAVAGDGGNIDLVEFDPETRTAYMLLQGACSGCPSSTITLKNGIETMLQQMLPGKVEKVEAING